MSAGGTLRAVYYGASKFQVNRVAPLQGLKSALQMLLRQIEELRPTRTGVGLRSGLSLRVTPLSLGFPGSVIGSLVDEYIVAQFKLGPFDLTQ